MSDADLNEPIKIRYLSVVSYDESEVGRFGSNESFALAL